MKQKCMEILKEAREDLSMKYSFDSYGLYKTEKRIRNVVRVRITMKEPVDLKVLRAAVNKATDRYPYFKKCVRVNQEGAYVLIDNPLPIVVMRTGKNAPPIGCREVNGHMLYVDTEGKDIYFCISHSLAGGKGIQPWVMTCIYQYVTDKYRVEPDVPAIRKPGSPFLATEQTDPDISMLSKEPPIRPQVYPRSYLLLKDYLNGLFNPLAKKEQYYVFMVRQKDFMEFCRENDSSVASLVSILHFKAFDKVLPKRAAIIRAQLAHNPCVTMGIPDAHGDFLSHINVDYKRSMANYDLERLGTISRGQIILQSDESCFSVELRKRFEMYQEIDGIHGLRNKRKYARKHASHVGKDSVRGTYNVNYTGYADWGELTEYIESYVLIVDGHMVCEVSALGDRIFFAEMALVNAKPYIKAMEAVLQELKIPYTLQGPFPKNLPWQDIPRR